MFETVTQIESSFSSSGYPSFKGKETRTKSYYAEHT